MTESVDSNQLSTSDLKCKVSSATRTERGDPSVSWLQRRYSKLAKFRYKVSNDVSDDKGDTSTSCSLQHNRSGVRNLTSDDNNITP